MTYVMEKAFYLSEVIIKWKLPLSVTHTLLQMQVVQFPSILPMPPPKPSAPPGSCNIQGECLSQQVNGWPPLGDKRDMFENSLIFQMVLSIPLRLSAGKPPTMPEPTSPQGQLGLGQPEHSPSQLSKELPIHLVSFEPYADLGRGRAGG